MAKSKTTPELRKIIYIFQGGGALGSFQVGGVEALAEHGYHCDMVVGISIGAMNAAIIAGNPPEQRVAKLKQFWQKITQDIEFPFPNFKMFAKLGQLSGALSALNGIPGFFLPRLINPFLLTNQAPDQLSFYDTSPLKATLHEVIDFDYLNQGHVRLCLGVTDLASGDFIFFDNRKDTIRAEHIMASGALPPGFPAIEIDGRYYVDGGVYANTPLSKVLDEFALNDRELQSSLCFMFDLFSAAGPLPQSMDGMLERVKDIQYSSHSKRASALYATTQNLSHAISFLASKLSEEAKADPTVQEVLKLGFAHRVDLVHIIYHSRRGTELNCKDYDFSRKSATNHWYQGYTTTKRIIEEKEAEWLEQHKEGTTIYTLEGDKIETISI